MKKTLIFLIMAIGFGCSSFHLGPEPTPNKAIVRTYVTSYTDEDYQEKLKAKPKLLFVKNPTDDIVVKSQNQKIIKDCKVAAETAGFQVSLDPNECKDCISVYLNHKFGQEEIKEEAQTSCGSYYSPYAHFGVGHCNTWIPTSIRNNRWVSLEFFPNGEKRPVHKIVAYSNGYVESVVKVAMEMCYAAFLTFPRSVEKEEYDVNWGLEKVSGGIVKNRIKSSECQETPDGSGGTVMNCN